MILDGKKISDNIKEELKRRIMVLESKPKLVVILVGENDASKVYVRNKIKACEKIGIDSEVILFDEKVSEEDLINKIHSLNIDTEVTGILVQLPLPKHIDEKKIIMAIDYKKDVDGFSPINIGRMALNMYSPISCTPKGIVRLLREYNIGVEGKKITVIGRSNIVGKPLSMLLVNMGATVSILNSKTPNIEEYTKNSDILIVAIGNPKFITSRHIDSCEAIIDVGINRDVNGRLCGDVDFDAVKDKVKFITPVPGGVGPMTIAMLMENCVELKEKYGSF